MIKVLKINRSKWRTGKDSKHSKGIGDTELLNNEGFMCCLGFLSLQEGIPKEKILEVSTPYELGQEAEDKLPYLLDTFKLNNKFCKTAMGINDSIRTTAEEKEERITKHFAKKGIKVVFTGKYKPKL